MASTITIREVPQEVLDSLKARAAAVGQSLRAYMLEAAKRTAALGSSQEWGNGVCSRQQRWAATNSTPKIEVDDILKAIADRT